jgi:putative membrane protein
VFAAVGIFFALIVIGWLFSIIFSATRYYGFRERHEKGLLLSHGLITQFQAVVPLGRIQMVRVVQPILYRLLGYCELYADTAGSFDKKDVASANKVCPIIREGGVAQIGKLLMPEFEFEGLLWNSVSRWSILRQAWGHIVVALVLFSVPLGMWLKWNALWLLTPLAIWGVAMGAMYFKYVGYAFTRDLLVSRQGVLRRESKMIPFDRIQHYTIQSSPLQRRLGLATVSAVSAATGRHQISIADVECESAQTLRQKIGEAIKSHLGSRRSGL